MKNIKKGNKEKIREKAAFLLSTMETFLSFPQTEKKIAHLASIRFRIFYNTLVHLQKQKQKNAEIGLLEIIIPPHLNNTKLG